MLAEITFPKWFAIIITLFNNKHPSWVLMHLVRQRCDEIARNMAPKYLRAHCGEDEEELDDDNVQQVKTRVGKDRRKKRDHNDMNPESFLSNFRGSCQKVSFLVLW